MNIIVFFIYSGYVPQKKGRMLSQYHLTNFVINCTIQESSAHIKLTNLIIQSCSDRKRQSNCFNRHHRTVRLKIIFILTLTEATSYQSCFISTIVFDSKNPFDSNNILINLSWNKLPRLQNIW